MTTSKDSSLLHAAEAVVLAHDRDDLDAYDALVEAIDNLHAVMEDQRVNEEVLPVMLAGIREELQRLGEQQAIDLFNDLILSLEEVVDLPLAHKLETEVLVKHEDVWEMVPKTPPGAVA